MKKILYILLMLILAKWAPAQQRTIYSINDGWRFSTGKVPLACTSGFDDSTWATVNIPHTWNDKDADDDTPGYLRGEAWYRKSLYVDKCQEGKTAILYFEGANQVVKVYVNGQYVGEHKGGYTRFSLDVTPYLHFGNKNLIAISVDNSFDKDIPPLSADFTFFGGIYRDVYLQFVNPVHIDTNDYASTGVYVTTPEVNESHASIQVTTSLTNGQAQAANIIVENTVYDMTGGKIASANSSIKLTANECGKKALARIAVNTPHLWDIDDPYLYSLHTRLYDKKSGELLDEVVSPLGLRWFSFDSEKGFFLNGKWRKLIGTARHQDFLGKGNALSDEYHVRDIRLLKDMGGNFLRVAHYPQDPTVLEMCDKLGIVASVEIPLVNTITESEAFLNNSVEMAKELVRQNFNHPSVIIWGYMNEILLRIPTMDSTKLDSYLKYTEKIATTLENTIRQEDPSRYTMMAYHNAPSLYEKAHLTDIPMIQGWNLYQGWYEPDLNDFQRLLERAHKQYKGKILMVTEYGPGVDPRVHSFKPERFDFSQEYGLVYHKHYLQEILKRPYIAGSSMWILNDFYSEPRIDAVPHVNNKGIVGLNREAKDTYLFYKANLSKSPMISIGNRTWKARGGTSLQSVPVFTNADSVELFANGRSLGVKASKSGIATYEVPFVNGGNELYAKATVKGVLLQDLLHVDFKFPIDELNVMLGSNRYFDDRDADVAWIPEQKYTPGSWGYVGGTPYRRKSGATTLLGSDIDILGTDKNPIFQTQRVGIDAFKADVPDGEYTVVLYWAEFKSETNDDALAYNLSGKSSEPNINERSFGVSINDLIVLEDFNIVRDYGYAHSVIKKFKVTVKDGKGLTVNFLAKEGSPILNAIRIYRNL